MKLLILFLAFIAMSVAANSDFYDGPPVRKCPPGEHSVLYCPQRAEPDCGEPTVHDLDGVGACGIPDCFCNKPTVRDLRTGKCVKLEDCPVKN